MIKIVREIINIISKKNILKLIFLQIFVLISALSEIVGILSIGPFMAVILDQNIIYENRILYFIYNYFSFPGQNEYLIFLGFLVLFLFSVSTLLTIFTSYKLLMFSSNVGAEIGNDLFKFYLSQNWLYFAEGNSNQFLRKISQEAERVSSGILQQLLTMNAKIVLSFFIITTVLIFNIYISLILFITYSLSYLLIYYLVKKRIEFHGQNVSDKQFHRFKIMSESFGGIKNIIVSNTQNFFIQNFEKVSNVFARSRGLITVYALLPRYFIELVSYGSLLMLTIFLLIINDGNINNVFISLSIFGIASLKLLPAFQSIYFCYSNFKGSVSAFDSIKNELKIYKREKNILADSKKYKNFNFENNIALENIFFTYKKETTNVLDNINLKISKGEVVGFVGLTGSGKSTLIDILMGLIKPNKGNLLVDENIINIHNVKVWFNKISHVPQSIFLADTSIRSNIAFGINEDKINNNRISQLLDQCEMREFIDNLPMKEFTNIGERGVQLSGGQRQRIGIARALYSNSDVIILDEATSSLDGYTESKIISNIVDKNKNKTLIIISHRLDILKECDNIFVLNNSKIVNSGKYNYLYENDETFKKMKQTNIS